MKNHYFFKMLLALLLLAASQHIQAQNRRSTSARQTTSKPSKPERTSSPTPSRSSSPAPATESRTTSTSSYAEPSYSEPDYSSSDDDDGSSSSVFNDYSSDSDDTPATPSLTHEERVEIRVNSINRNKERVYRTNMKMEQKARRNSRGWGESRTLTYSSGNPNQVPTDSNDVRIGVAPDRTILRDVAPDSSQAAIFYTDGTALVVTFEPGYPDAENPIVFDDTIIIPPNDPVIGTSSEMQCPQMDATAPADVYPSSSLLACIEMGLQQLERMTQKGNWGESMFRRRFYCELMHVKGLLDKPEAANFLFRRDCYYRQWLYYYDLYQAKIKQYTDPSSEMLLQYVIYFEEKARHIQSLMPPYPEEAQAKTAQANAYFLRENAGRDYVILVPQFNPAEVYAKLKTARLEAGALLKNTNYIYLSNFFSAYPLSEHVDLMEHYIHINMEKAENLRESNPNQARIHLENAEYFNEALSLMCPHKKDCNRRARKIRRIKENF